MCKKCAELKRIYEEANKVYWDTVYTEDKIAGEKATAAWDIYHAQAMKHAHHKEEQ